MCSSETSCSYHFCLRYHHILEEATRSNKSKGHQPAAPDAAVLRRRDEVSKRCPGVVIDMKTKRHETRKAKRTSEDGNAKNTTYVVRGVASTNDFLKDNTGILNPEASDGPYLYPESQVLRQDIVEHRSSQASTWVLCHVPYDVPC